MTTDSDDVRLDEATSNTLVSDADKPWSATLGQHSSAAIDPNTNG
jgi:hypothetical protein